VKARCCPQDKDLLMVVSERFLTCYSELVRRHVMNSKACKLDESLFHVMVDFQHGKLIWLTQEDQQGINLPILHPRSWA
jgi:hypothetical protein